MKKTLFLFLLFIAVVAGYFYYSKPKPPIFKGVENIHLQKIGETGVELDAEIIFLNNNSMRTQLGKIDATISLNKTIIGELHEAFDVGISPNSEYRYPIRIRYEKEDVPWIEYLPVDITGTAASSTIFSNYLIPFEFHTRILKN